jgi:hypothetical protein
VCVCVSSQSLPFIDFLTSKMYSVFESVWRLLKNKDKNIITRQQNSASSSYCCFVRDYHLLLEVAAYTEDAAYTHTHTHTHTLYTHTHTHTHTFMLCVCVCVCCVCVCVCVCVTYNNTWSGTKSNGEGNGGIYLPCSEWKSGHWTVGVGTDASGVSVLVPLY